jgi:hypothetical protein
MQNPGQPSQFSVTVESRTAWRSAYRWPTHLVLSRLALFLANGGGHQFVRAYVRPKSFETPYSELRIGFHLAADYPVARCDLD